jgi:hypothetical protein
VVNMKANGRTVGFTDNNRKMKEKRVEQNREQCLP